MTGRGGVRSSARLSGDAVAAATAAAPAAPAAPGPTVRVPLGRGRPVASTAAAALRRARAAERAREVEDSPRVLREKCRRLARALRNAKHLVVYTGAGISTAADIPDYRGPDGVWTRLQRGETVGRVEVSRARPTFTHMALTALWERGALKFVVSQNCDGLHLRSGLPRRALAELHGDMFAELCAPCRRVYLRAFDTTERTARHQHGTRRLCHACGTELRDSIVHFGERGRAAWPLNWAGALRHAARADVVLCLGSSLKVLRRYPRLWRMQSAPRARPALYIVNLQWTPKDSVAALKINARCDAVMQQVARRLRLRVPRYRAGRDPVLAHAEPLAAQEHHTTRRPLLRAPAEPDDSASDEWEPSSPSASDSDEELPLRRLADRLRGPSPGVSCGSVPDRIRGPSPNCLRGFASDRLRGPNPDRPPGSTGDRLHDPASDRLHGLTSNCLRGPVPNRLRRPMLDRPLVSVPDRLHRPAFDRLHGLPTNCVRGPVAGRFHRPMPELLRGSTLNRLRCPAPERQGGSASINQNGLTSNNQSELFPERSSAPTSDRPNELISDHLHRPDSDCLRGPNTERLSGFNADRLCRPVPGLLRGPIPGRLRGPAFDRLRGPAPNRPRCPTPDRVRSHAPNSLHGPAPNCLREPTHDRLREGRSVIPDQNTPELHRGLAIDRRRSAPDGPCESTADSLPGLTPDGLRAFKVTLQSGEVTILLRAEHAPSTPPCASMLSPQRCRTTDLRRFRMVRHASDTRPLTVNGHSATSDDSRALPMSPDETKLAPVNGAAGLGSRLRRLLEYEPRIDADGNAKRLSADCESVTAFKSNDLKSGIKMELKLEAKLEPKSEVKDELKREGSSSDDERSALAAGTLAAAIIRRAVLLCRASLYPGLHTIIAQPAPVPRPQQTNVSAGAECAWCARHYSARRCLWYGPPRDPPPNARAWRRVRGRRYLCACCGAGQSPPRQQPDAGPDEGGWYGKGYRKGRRRRR